MKHWPEDGKQIVSMETPLKTIQAGERLMKQLANDFGEQDMVNIHENEEVQTIAAEVRRLDLKLLQTQKLLWESRLQHAADMLNKTVAEMERAESQVLT